MDYLTVNMLKKYIPKDKHERFYSAFMFLAKTGDVMRAEQFFSDVSFHAIQAYMFLGSMGVRDFAAQWRSG